MLYIKNVTILEITLTEINSPILIQGFKADYYIIPVNLKKIAINKGIVERILKDNAYAKIIWKEMIQFKKETINKDTPLKIGDTVYKSNGIPKIITYCNGHTYDIKGMGKERWTNIDLRNGTWFKNYSA